MKPKSVLKRKKRNRARRKPEKLRWRIWLRKEKWNEPANLANRPTA